VLQQTLLLHARRLTHRAACVVAQLAMQYGGEFPPLAVSQPHPNEMEDLVQQNASQQAWAAQQRCIQNNLASANEAGRMNWPAAVCAAGKQLAVARSEPCGIAHHNRPAYHRRDRAQGACKPCVIAEPEV
jgi:hypothetical protein